MSVQPLVRFVLTIGVLGGSVTAWADQPNRSTTPTRPNIVVILVDDLGWAAVGPTGNGLVTTPHIDRLAARGMTFTSAYAEPQCTPTRASLLTGQTPARNGMWHVIPWYGYPWARVREPAFVENLSPETFTLADGLKRAGYRTACLGKWHVTRNETGNYVTLHPESAADYGFDVVADPPTPNYHQTGEKGVDYLTDRAMAFMETSRDRPFFCLLSHHTIHGPVLAPEPLVRKYRDRGYPEVGLNNAIYLAALEHLDNSVGRLTRRIGELGIEQNTIVIFVSDNGGVDGRYDHRPFLTPTSPPHRLTVRNREFDNAPLRMGKGSAYEGGIRVPWIVSWPGITPPGSRCDHPVHVSDLLPTLIAAADGSVPASHPIDGSNLQPLLRRGDTLPASHPLATRSLHWFLPLYDIRWGLTPCAVIRRGDWKLIEHFGDRFDAAGVYRAGHHVELFDLKTDPDESNNLANAHPDRTADLLAKLHRWMQSIPVSAPELNPRHDPTRTLFETRDRPDWLKPRR